MVSTKAGQLKSVMDEISKMNIQANDMRRRLLNTDEGLGAVVDQYAVKLLRSGYDAEQTKNKEDTQERNKRI